MTWPKDSVEAHKTPAIYLRIIMPVIPENIPPFEITSPTTMGDIGLPTDSLLVDAERVFKLIHDERHLTAERLYLDVQCRVDEYDRHCGNVTKPHSKFAAPWKGLTVSHKNKRTKLDEERSAKEVQQVKALFQQKEAILQRLVVSNRGIC